MKREEETSKKRNIEVTIKEKPRKKQKPAQNSVSQIKTSVKQGKNKQRNPKKAATTTSTIISKQPSAHARMRNTL
jgi:hypothetical protein